MQLIIQSLFLSAYIKIACMKMNVYEYFLKDGGGYGYILEPALEWNSFYGKGHIFLIQSWIHIVMLQGFRWNNCFSEWNLCSVNFQKMLDELFLQNRKCVECLYNAYRSPSCDVSTNWTVCAALLTVLIILIVLMLTVACLLVSLLNVMQHTNPTCEVCTNWTRDTEMFGTCLVIWFTWRYKIVPILKQTD